MVEKLNSPSDQEKIEIIELPNIPKSREIFRGDINEAVITVQQVTGFEITPDWWLSEVGNDGPTEDILDRFDVAFEKLIRQEMGVEDPAEDDEKESTTPSQEDVMAEGDAQVAEFDERFKDDPGAIPLRQEFIKDLREHLEQKYFSDELNHENIRDMVDFELTAPESRRYTADEDYRFLIHVPLGNTPVKQRGSEIGTERDGVLITSLVSGEHQATFNGEGGFILGQPEDDVVIGMASSDTAGEIHGRRMDDIDELLRPATNADYNQIDLKFAGTHPIGVMLKVDSGGNELGDKARNDQLRQFAEEHNLPVVEIEVEPDAMPEETNSRREQLPDGQGVMTTVDTPFDSDRFARVQVFEIGEDNEVYHAKEGSKYVARTMLIDGYGQTTQQITREDFAKVLEQIAESGIELDENMRAQIEADWQSPEQDS